MVSSPKNVTRTGGDVVSDKRVVLGGSLREVLTPLDGKRLAQSLCIEEGD